MGPESSNTAAPGLRWLVGVDPRDLSRGAVAFARGMAARARRDRFVASYVFEESWLKHLGLVSAAIDPDQPQKLADQVLGPLVDDPVFTLSWTRAASATQGLAAQLDEHNCDALIVGRRNPTEGLNIVRLGRVARRLVRSLPRPVVVVPPDASADVGGGGPILLATGLDDTSTGAACFAARLGASLDMDLLVAHVATRPDAFEHVVRAEDWEPPLDQTRVHIADRLAAWVSAQELSGARTTVVLGSTLPELLEVAKVSGASMIVVGSRELGLGDRLIYQSLGTDLAANAKVPVAVVPPDWRG